MPFDLKLNYPKKDLQKYNTLLKNKYIKTIIVNENQNINMNTLILKTSE